MLYRTFVDPIVFDEKTVNQIGFEVNDRFFRAEFIAEFDPYDDKCYVWNYLLIETDEDDNQIGVVTTGEILDQIEDACREEMYEQSFDREWDYVEGYEE